MTVPARKPSERKRRVPLKPSTSVRSVRLTAAEWDSWTAAAAVDGLTVSAWIKRVVADQLALDAALAGEDPKPDRASTP
jgi:hypothetical protein